MYQSRQTNYLAEQANGEYLILQSAEIAYVDNVIDDMSRFCSDKHAVFAHVLSSEKPTVNNDLSAILNLDWTKRLLGTVFPGINLAFDHLTCSSYYGMPNRPLLDHITQEKNQGCTVLPSYVLWLQDRSHTYQEYTGPLRPIPLFFCGMIKRSDFLACGGYQNVDKCDIEFGNKMASEGFSFTFVKSIAIHINHDKQ
jgi:hypothetical protein